MEYLGLGKTAFTGWKSGKNTSYNKHIGKIAEFFGVSTDYLLGRTDEPKPKKLFIPTQENQQHHSDVMQLSSDVVMPIPEYQKANKETSNNDQALMFALYGNDTADITPEMLEDIRDFAKFIREKKKGAK